MPLALKLMRKMIIFNLKKHLTLPSCLIHLFSKSYNFMPFTISVKCIENRYRLIRQNPHISLRLRSNEKFPALTALIDGSIQVRVPRVSVLKAVLFCNRADPSAPSDWGCIISSHLVGDISRVEALRMPFLQPKAHYRPPRVPLPDWRPPWMPCFVPEILSSLYLRTGST